MDAVEFPLAPDEAFGDGGAGGGELVGWFSMGIHLLDDVANVDIPTRRNGRANNHIFAIDNGGNGTFHFRAQGSCFILLFHFRNQIEQPEANLVLGQIRLGVAHRTQSDLFLDVFKPPGLD